MKAGDTISDYSLDMLRPDFVKFNLEVFNKIRARMMFYPEVPYPKTVIRFSDKLVRIRTKCAKSLLIRLAYKDMIDIMSTFWSNYNAFAEFLYTYVPLLNSYTMKQKQRIMQTFQEDHFNPGQVIIRERGDLTHIYIIIEG